MVYDFEQDGWESVFDLHLRYHCDEALCTDTLRYEVFDGATWSPMQGSIYFNAQGFFAAAVSKSSVPSPKTAFAVSSTPQKLLVQLPPSPDDTRLLVSDINGKVLFTQQLPHSDDISLHQINIGQLPPGVYIAHILGANIRETTKFIRI